MRTDQPKIDPAIRRGQRLLCGLWTHSELTYQFGLIAAGKLTGTLLITGHEPGPFLETYGLYQGLEGLELHLDGMIFQVVQLTATELHLRGPKPEEKMMQLVRAIA